MTDATYGVIVLAVSFAAATLGAIIITFLVQMRDALAGRARAPEPPAPVQPARPRRIVYPFEAALRSIPGAEVRAPLAGHGHGHGVIVASTDAAFIATVRAALRAVHGVDVYLIAGIAAPDPQDDPQGRGRYLWGECWRDGVPLGSEPRRRYPLSTLAHSQDYYWLVRPIAAAALPASLPVRRQPLVGEIIDWLGEW